MCVLVTYSSYLCNMQHHLETKQGWSKSKVWTRPHRLQHTPAGKTNIVQHQNQHQNTYSGWPVASKTSIMLCFDAGLCCFFPHRDVPQTTYWWYYNKPNNPCNTGSRMKDNHTGYTHLTFQHQWEQQKAKTDTEGVIWLTFLDVGTHWAAFHGG